MPPVTFKTFLLAGLAGELLFEAYAWLLSPLLFGVALAPANLVVALTQIATGLTLPYWLGFGLHFAIGALGFTATVLLVHWLSRSSLILSGALAGVGLWFVAQGLLAPAVGRSFMMGFGAYTQSSFVGHVAMAMAIGWVLQKLSTQRAAAP